MRLRLAAVLTASAAAVAVMAAPASAHDPQRIRLDVSTGDGQVSGYADLTVTAEHGGYWIRGTVTDAYQSHGCVTLKAVEMHWGMDFGGNTVAKACSPGKSVNVDSVSGHHYVVLQVDEPHTVDFESKIVKLTG